MLATVSIVGPGSEPSLLALGWLRALAAPGAPTFDGRWIVLSPDAAQPAATFRPDWDVPHRSGY